jgi:hypothetical protein
MVLLPFLGIRQRRAVYSFMLTYPIINIKNQAFIFMFPL